MLQDQVPKIFQSCTHTAIIVAMHEFRWEKYFVPVQYGINYIIIVGIMPGIRAIKFFPGMNDQTLLRIIEFILVIQRCIPSSFIAVIPNYDRRVINFPDDELLY